MKKSLIALAVLASAGVASAQSSVTLFGVVDATYAIGQGKGANSSNKTQLTNSGYNSSRLGFRGVEDLGGGLSASFWLEAGIGNDDGRAGGTIAQTNQPGTITAGNTGLNFNRRSTVSVSGGFGEVRLGRDYSPQFWNTTVFDPFGTNGVGTTLTTQGGPASITAGSTGFTGVTGTRASNSIGYFLPRDLGGFYGQFMYHIGENNRNGAVNEKDGDGYGLRVGYANGPINVAFSTSETKYAAIAGVTASAPGVVPVVAAVAQTSGKITQTSVGGQYDFGVAKLMGQYVTDKQSRNPSSAKATGYLIGGLIPLGAGEVRVAYSQYKIKTSPASATSEPTASKFALGYVHNLSKRTALYATYANIKNKNGSNLSVNGAVTAANNGSTGYDFGVRHSF